ncbi:hypothetical protein NC653_020827 [Populus alba x Populus x berolinensis]|uniref:Uncharacterized protein n=1 Tax=Populus alba x Populus x berolinensis TaxID=444605 RepID=A0AAD6MLQ3_9ROSI|nr:hypothetical protein NC653_020827 [Populus alba x Populus x berolinensis]
MGGNTPLEGPLASTCGEERWSANHSPIWAFILWWLTLLSTQQKVLGNFKVKVRWGGVVMVQVVGCHDDNINENGGGRMDWWQQ